MEGVAGAYVEVGGGHLFSSVRVVEGLVSDGHIADDLALNCVNYRLIGPQVPTSSD